jgi:hypothetical protein
MSEELRAGVLMPRDFEVVDWLDRVGAATSEQIAARFALGRTQVYRRLQVLRGFGLIRRRRLLATCPLVYTPADRSLRPASCQHALALAELIVARERAGAVVLGEVELRRERAGQAVLGSRLGDAELQTLLGCGRVPDAVEVIPSGGLLAYEIELSSKGERRRQAVIAAYAASQYERVNWIAPNRQLGALLRGEILALGVDAFMEVSDRLPSG